MTIDTRLKALNHHAQEFRMTDTRPLTYVWVLVYVVSAMTVLWFMHIYPAAEQVPVAFDVTVSEHKKLFNGAPLKTEYTGISPVDWMLTRTTAAFMPAVSGPDPEIRLQQQYLLIHFFAICCIWIVEAHRERNAWRLISLTNLFVVPYQLLGAAVVYPVYHIAFLLSSASSVYWQSGRQVPLRKATALLPALVLGQGIPTVLLYLPWNDMTLRQNFTAFWQVSPLLPNILVWLFSFGGSSADTRKDADVPHLKRVYLFAALASFVSHVTIVYVCLTSTDPRVSLASVFVPSTATWKTDMAHGLHWVFQWDFCCFPESLLWAWLNVTDVWRLSSKRVGVARLTQTVVLIGAITALGGPGAAMAAVWYWREDELIDLERSLSNKAGKLKAK